MKKDYFPALFDQMIDDYSNRNKVKEHPIAGVVKNRLLQMAKKTTHVECMLSGFDICNEIINAHSIQNSRILDKLSVNGKLIWWDNHSQGDDKIEGRNKATTFKGFCKYHDEIFNPIEHRDYVVGDKEQEFLFAYRAFSKEYNFLYETKIFFEWYDEELKEDSASTKLYHHVAMKKDVSIEDGRAGRQKVGKIRNKIRLEDITKHLQKFDKLKAGLTTNLSRGRFDRIETHVFESNKSNTIACSSMPFIMTDLEGNLFNRQLNIPAFLTIIPQGDKTIILFSYFKKTKLHFEKLIKQMESLSVEENEIVFSNIIMRYCQNVVFPPKKFDNFNKEQMREIDWITNRRTQYPSEKLVISKINLFN